MAGRKRRPNWTEDESLLLAKLLREKKDVIRGKSSSGVLPQERKQAWEEISKTINNTFPETQRTVSDCSKKWENLLAKAKEEIKRVKRDMGQTEVQSLENYSAVSQIVISVMNFSETLLNEEWICKSGCEKMRNDHANDETVPKSEERLDASCWTPWQPAHSRTAQERLDLEMSVLRRQERVLKLQEEYYTLKIKMMKKQMEGPIEME